MAENIPPSPQDRRLWRRLQARLTIFQRLDSWLFARINSLPHPPWFDWTMQLLATVMNRGDGWLVGLLIAIIAERNLGRQRIIQRLGRVAPALWLSTFIVEFGFKQIFRRPRPFAQRAQAVLVGAPPRRHSFPSGHTAAAFAGAWLLSQEYPRQRFAFYLLALLVAFSRVYLGVHYPGDTVAGAVSGVSLAASMQRLLRIKRRRP
jgi:undecaprenyl-diphosphatase